MRKPRIYADTSVFGGCFDTAFKDASLKLIRCAVEGKVLLLVSDLVGDELDRAPSRVRHLFESIPEVALETLPLTPGIALLRDAYLKAGILTERSTYDAWHVATATFHRSDAIVSWNFKHIVQLGKMRAYNRVNAEQGFGHLNIVTPQEVIHEDT